MHFEGSEWMNGPRGGIEVICGSMFSGKTEELIRRLKRARFAHQKVEIYKPAIDTRYDVVRVVSHDSTAVDSVPVQTASEILLNLGDAEVVAIDEAQFFGPEIVEVCTGLAAEGRRVIVAGLDMDFEGRPFGPMPALMAVAESVTKVHAVCVRCGNPAQFSHRLSASKDLVQLGETDTYEPLCRHCYLETVRSESEPSM